MSTERQEDPNDSAPIQLGVDAEEMAQRGEARRRRPDPGEAPPPIPKLDATPPADPIGKAIRFGCGTLAGLLAWPIFLGRAFDPSSPYRMGLMIALGALLFGYLSMGLRDGFWKIVSRRRHSPTRG